MPAEPQAWSDSGVADEVEAFLHGRLVERLTAAVRTLPAWSALNRVAHADHCELLSGLGDDPSVGRPRRRLPWAETERFLAARLLAAGGGVPDGVRRVQSETLVPLELSMIDRVAAEGLGAADVLVAAAEKMDSRGSHA